MRGTTLLCVALSLATPIAARAADSPFLMPEGTSEYAIGMFVNRGKVDGDKALDRDKVGTSPHLHFEARWSNGIFINGLWLGKEMSGTPNLSYGPMFTMTRERSVAPGADTRWVPVFGAYASYALLHDLSLGARGYQVGGGDGAQLNVQATWHKSVGQHQGISIGVGTNLVDRRFLQTNLRAGPDAAGGVKDVYVEARLRWELNAKYTLAAGVDRRRLKGSAAASPLAPQRGNTGYAVGLIHYF